MSPFSAKRPHNVLDAFDLALISSLLEDVGFAFPPGELGGWIWRPTRTPVAA
jgi:hypothetical protein